MGENATASLDVAVGASRLSTAWKNKKTTWAELCDQLTTTTHTAETVAEFKKLSKPDRDRVKDRGGFVGGYLTGRRRLKNAVRFRQIITLDADFATEDTWPKFKARFPGVAALVYSTHSHTTGAPKLRIVFPVDRRLDLAEYMALARYVAGAVGIEDFDPTTYAPERLMYWPSTPKDGQFFSEVVEGPWVEADRILAKYVDWKDATSWPTSERESDIVRRQIKKLGDPTEKVGLIGAFCRVYRVDAAIETFLQEQYQAGDAGGRYTYKKGTSANGLVLYDDAKFATSHHGTDPASGQTLNAFDLVRIHLFGEEDEEVEPDTPTTKRPSYKKMQALAAADPKVRKLIGKERLDMARGEFAGLDEPEEDPDDPNADWLESLKPDKAGNVECTIANIVTILQHDPVFRGAFLFNEFKRSKEIVRDLPWRKIEPGAALNRFSDDDVAGVLRYLEQIYGMHHVGKTEAALALIFQEFRYHPVRIYLDGLQWDGIPRVETLLCDYMGATDTPYVRAITRKFLIGAVARVMRPGVKFDWVVVLIGAEGTGKSTLLRRLGGAWFSDTFNTVEGQKAYEAVDGHWIIEMGELAALKRAEIITAKHFISKDTDTYRPAYGKYIVEVPRQCVFAATTNESNFLRGVEGNRRFWPVTCGESAPVLNVFQDLDEARRGQLWAEAFQLYQSGEPLYLPKEMELEARKRQREHVERDDREGMVEAYLDKLLPAGWDKWDVDKRRTFIAGADLIEGTEVREFVTAIEIWTECFGERKELLKKVNSMEIQAILYSLGGWERQKGHRRSGPYGHQRFFRRTADLLTEKPLTEDPKGEK